ncbi:hypothetical protein [Oenococcus sp.]|uniref:hypothetical protein n=1 Tax=Oenococcus sp. TaxID=1979414 RepID=UPI0039EA41F9
MQATDDILDILVDQLQQDIGYKLKDLKAFEGKIPGSIKYTMDLLTAEISSDRIILLFPHQEKNLKIDFLKFWVDQFKVLGLGTAVIVLRDPVRSFQTLLTKNRISFISLRHDYYLPFMALRMLETNLPSEPPKVVKNSKLSQKATQLLTVLIYASNFAKRQLFVNTNSVFNKSGYMFTGGKQLFEELAKVAGFETIRTMNRALLDLESANVIQSIGSQTRKTYAFQELGMDLFYSVIEIMRSPVKLSITADRQLMFTVIRQKFSTFNDISTLDGASFSGLTAIAKITDLESDMSQLSYAFSKQLFNYVFDRETKQIFKNSSIGSSNAPGNIRIERWSDDPDRISNWLRRQSLWNDQRIPDPISLYLANTEKNDSRVTGILEDLIEATFEGRKYG